MNQALKGVLATYGIDQTINTLLDLIMAGIGNSSGKQAMEITLARENLPNDVDFLARLMECQAAKDPETNQLEKLNTKPTWQYENDQAEFEQAGENLRITQLKWMDE